MSAIKQHILRINVKGKGYSLYSGDSFGRFKEQPLDLASSDISHTFLNVQKRLDAVLETGKLSWSMSFRYDEGQNPIVAYGCFIKKPDEYNRTGLFFIHAVELSSCESLFSCVSSIITLLSNSGVRTISKAVEDIAIGKREVYDFLTTICQKVDEILALTPEYVVYKNSEKINIGNIEHDCAGAVATAWLIMAGVIRNAKPPWEIYDTIGGNGNILTIKKPSEFSNTELASHIQRQSLEYFFNLNPSSVLNTYHETTEAENSHVENFNGTKPTELNLLQKIIEKQLKISIVLSTICLLAVIVGVVVVFYIVNRDENLRSQLLVELDSRFNSFKQPNGEIGQPPETKEPPKEQELRLLLSQLFDKSKNVRQKALDDLAIWKSDARLIPIALEYSEKNSANDVGVYFVILLMEKIDTDQLKQHKDSLIPFFDKIKSNGTATETRVVNIEQRLNAIP